MPVAPSGDPIDELRPRGYTVLRNQFPADVVSRVRAGVIRNWEKFLEAAPTSNRGPHRYYLPLPFESDWFSATLFTEPEVLRIVCTVLDDRVVADQWGCDVPLLGSCYQQPHIDYARPLFAEAPDLQHPPFAMVVSVGVSPIRVDDGPIEIAPGTQLMLRSSADAAIDRGEIRLEPVLLDVGDVLIRNPWTLHRGSPNLTSAPRLLVSVRYVRRWYADDSREVATIPSDLWKRMPEECRRIMRFPISFPEACDR